MEDAELITCVICQQTFGVADTTEHVRRHRRSDKEFPNLAMVSTIQPFREPQIRPIVEPQEFVMKPTENYYVVEKVGKGGRSSFTEYAAVGVSQIPVVSQLPIPITEVAKTKVIEVFD